MDVGGKCAGTVLGSMNMAAQLGGFVAPIVVRARADLLRRKRQAHRPGRHRTNPVLDATKVVHAWTVIFCIYVAFYFIGGLAWLFLDPVTPVEVDEPGAKPTGFPVIVDGGQDLSDKR